MNIKKAILLLLGIIIIDSCNKTDKKFSREMNRADSLSNSANYKEAKELYQKIYRENPDNKDIEIKINKVDSLLKLNRSVIQYQEIIKIADSLFNNSLFDEAEYAYQEASMILPEEYYPIDKIAEIRDIQNPYSDSIENTYHLIVGCFEVEENALRLQKKLLANGFESRFISRKNGTMKAVTYTSHPDIHDAYNNLNRVQRNVQRDTWVLRHNFE